MVTLIEDSIIELLGNYHIHAESDKKAPGVYVDRKKIAALGIRVSRGCTTHGLSLNVDMNLSPFKNINPCGYEGLEIAQCKELGIEDDLGELENQLVRILVEKIQTNTTS